MPKEHSDLLTVVTTEDSIFFWLHFGTDQFKLHNTEIGNAELRYSPIEPP